MDLSENGKLVLSRYLLKDNQGKVIEKPEQLLKRVAKDIAKEDSKYLKNPKKLKKELGKTEKSFFEAMDSLDFLPNLPVLANSGRKLEQLAACFVLPIEDNMESIFQSVKEMAIIQKSGGGTGFSFSRLRPEGSLVSETGGIASGPVSFMKVFDAATAAIKEGGIRRGANMGILRVEHPDIEKFISSKELGQLQNFNISVALTEEFMRSVKEGKDFPLSFQGKICKIIKARSLFNLISKHAWANGEPGIIFIDEMNKTNPLPKLGEIEATNPCSEIPLLPYESCILGSINLSNMIKAKKIDYKKLEKTIKIAVHFLDNCIDASSFPLPETEKIVKANRKIGLGVMGFSDFLIKMDIQYDSQKAEKIAEQIMGFIEKKSIEASEELAEERGAFSNFSQSIFRKEKERRNATLTAIAPTGTIAILADCSEGIEPLFGLLFNRNSSFGLFQELHPLFMKEAKKLKLDEREMERIAMDGSLKNTSLPEKEKRIYRTAHDISSEWHLRILSAFQKHTDNSISKTLNLPHSATIEEIENIFMHAWKLKCKGLTVYRYNSRREQVLEFCKKCNFRF